jgi:hypothetical protein
MQHDDWATAIKGLMNSADTTADEWGALLQQTEAAARSSVGDWHIQQTLGLYAGFLRDNENPEAASQLDVRIGDDADEQIRYWHAASANSLAHAALDHFKADNKTEAVALAKRAMYHFGHTADNPFPVFETLIAQLRSHLESQAQDA